MNSKLLLPIGLLITALAWASYASFSEGIQPAPPTLNGPTPMVEKPKGQYPSAAHGSLVDSYATLSGRAKAGDKDAAVTLFEEESECQGIAQIRLRLHQETYEIWLSSAASMLSGRSESDQEAIKRREHNIYSALAQDKTLCSHLDESFSDGRIYDDAMLAARNGDVNAAACLLEARWQMKPMTDVELVEFDEERFKIAEGDVEKGSWVAVHALKDIYNGMGSANQIAGHPHWSRVDYLRMAYLEQLGRTKFHVSDSYADKGVLLAEIDVDENEVLQAEAWATNEFFEHFSGDEQPLPSNEHACARPGEP